MGGASAVELLVAGQGVVDDSPRSTVLPSARPGAQVPANGRSLDGVGRRKPGAHNGIGLALGRDIHKSMRRAFDRWHKLYSLGEYKVYALRSRSLWPMAKGVEVRPDKRPFCHETRYG